MRGKAARKPANFAAPSSEKQWGEMIAIDPIVGLPRSLRGNTYCYMIRGSNPKISRAYPAKRNRAVEWVAAIRQYMIDAGLVVNSTIHGPQCIQSGQDSAMRSAEMQAFLRQMGIKCRHSPSNRHEMNGWIEGDIRHKWESVVACLWGAEFNGLQIDRARLWDYTVEHVCFVAPLLPGLSRDDHMPGYEQETDEAPDYNWVPAPFGTEVEVEFPKSARGGKLATHTRSGWFLKNDTHAPRGTYIVLMKDTHRTVSSFDVYFDPMPNTRHQPTTEDTSYLFDEESVPPPPSLDTSDGHIKSEAEDEDDSEYVCYFDAPSPPTTAIAHTGDETYPKLNVRAAPPVTHVVGDQALSADDTPTRDQEVQDAPERDVPDRVDRDPRAGQTTS